MSRGDGLSRGGGSLRSAPTRGAALLLAGALLGALVTGCAGAPADAGDAAGAGSEPDTTATTEPDESSAETPEPASCVGIDLVPERTITGEALADCIIDAMRAAGSGRNATVSEATASSAQWRFGERYEVYAEVDEFTRMVSDGERAWIDFEGTGWVLADPDQPGGTMFQVVEHWLETTGPEVMRSMIAATDWVVDEQESVELHAGDSDTLFPVRATPFAWQGASVESMTLWMGAPGQVRRQDTTANAFGFSAETTTYHFGWGEPVEIPIPE